MNPTQEKGLPEAVERRLREIASKLVAYNDAEWKDRARAERERREAAEKERDELKRIGDFNARVVLRERVEGVVEELERRAERERGIIQTLRRRHEHEAANRQLCRKDSYREAARLLQSALKDSAA